MPSIIIENFKYYFIKYSYLYGIYTIIYLKKQTEVKLPAQSLTETKHMSLDSSKYLYLWVISSFVAIAKRKYVGICEGLENLYGEGMTGFIVPKVNLVILLGSEVEVYAKFEVTVLCHVNSF